MGIDISVSPLDRLSIGGQLTTWLLASEAGLYARYAIIRALGNSITLGARLHAITSLLADGETPPNHGLVSIEAGYERLDGHRLLAVEVGKAIWADGGWCPCSQINPGVTGELRLGYVW